MLLDAGYLSVRRTGRNRHEIAAHKYVGRILADDIELRIVEKVPGTVSALIAAASGRHIRIHKADSPATELGALSLYLMAQFVVEAGRYVADRRKARYAYATQTGPLLGGALDMPLTLRINASGGLGRFGYRTGRVVRDEPLDRLVLAGLDELDKTSSALGLDQKTRYEARWLAGALEEVREVNLGMRREEHFKAAEEIEHTETSSDEDKDLARLATAALHHRGFEQDLPSGDEVPRAWFIDLETLFEQAVRRELQSLFSYFVDQGDRYDRHLFMEGSDPTRTHPDVVIHSSSSVIAVGDVKYKNPQESIRSDIYQLLAHADALGAKKTFLVYASDGSEYRSRYLGQTRTSGVAMRTAMVRPTHLVPDLERFAEDLQI